MIKRLVCALVGHRWDWRRHSNLPDAPYRCERCRHYDDEPGIKRAAHRRAWLRTYSPIWPSVTKTGASLRLGWAWRPITANVWMGLHWGWDRNGELPGVSFSLDVLRLRMSAGIGGGWQDEDGETRGFIYFQGRLKTYGWRYVGCWFGHKPEPSSWDDEYVYCARCDATLEYPDRKIVSKAAA